MKLEAFYLGTTVLREKRKQGSKARGRRREAGGKEKGRREAAQQGSREEGKQGRSEKGKRVRGGKGWLQAALQKSLGLPRGDPRARRNPKSLIQFSCFS